MARLVTAGVARVTNMIRPLVPRSLNLSGRRFKSTHVAALLMLGCASLLAVDGDTTVRSASNINAAPQSIGHADHSAAVEAAPAAGMQAAAAAVAAFTLPENIPDFSQDTLRTAVESVASGNWSSPSTWQGGKVPTANNVVRILQAHAVTIADTSAVAYTVVVDGKLAFAPTVNTRLKVTNLEVMAGNMGMGTPGVLEVGTAATPIAGSVIAEIIIANSPLGGSVSDTDQFGTGIIVLGKASMHGSVKTPTFVRLATEPRAGSTTLTLSQAVSGWKVGDRLVLPDTRHIKESEVTGSGWVNAVNQWEERTVRAVSADGKTLTLNSALQYDHLGARDLNGVLDFLPHVGNLTRNVIVRSESATGTRGHMLGIHRAEVDIRYALFKDMGRTTYLPLNDTSNHIGRYPIHMHHLSGPLPTPANGYQFTLLGNAVDGGSVETKFKWGITVHGSHYGSIKDNVVYNYNGAAIATEDGSESFNVFDHNFVLRGIGEPDDSVSEARMAMGTEGVGFWFRGPNNFVKNNVAANYQNPTTEAAYGFAYQLRYLGNVAVPNFKGAMNATDFTTKDGNNLPILQFENNEAYGAMQGGFTYWWVSSQDPAPGANGQESLIKDLKLWHIYNKTVYHYPSQKVTFDGLKIRGNASASTRCCGDGVYFPDYAAKNIIIRNSDIQGVETGIDAPVGGMGPGPQLLVENTYLRNQTNINVGTNWSVNGCWMDNKLVEIRNTRFEAPPGRSLSAINMARSNSNGIECLSKLDEVRVYAYNGNAADNFQIYHTNTAVLPRPPSSCTPATRAGISSGVTCPIAAQGPVVPTATFSVAPTSISSGQSATLSWSTTNATTVAINQGVGTVAASGTRSVSPTATTTYTLTATNGAGSVNATATVTVGAATRITPTITWNNPASIIYPTPLSATQLNATTTVPGSWTYSPVAGTVLSAGAGQTLSVTFTPTDTAKYNAASKTVALTVLKATPLITWANPADIPYGTPLSATQLNATANKAGTFAYTPPSGTVLGVGAGQTLSVNFTPTSTNYNPASKTVSITVTGTPTTTHNAARANSYDDAWQTGSSGWVANAKAILAGGSGQIPGMVLWIGDSLTRDPALGAWAQRGAGKTADDQMITTWMHAGLSPQSIDSIDGFALATPYFCSARSYTVGDNLGAWDFMGGGMPADPNPATAKQKLQNCTLYPNALNLTTMLAALQKPQFAIPEVNLDAANPASFPDLQRMVDLLISKGIVPIILTYTYRTDATFNALVDRYNTALVQYAQTKKLPLIDFNKEMLARLPFSQWPGRFLSDGVHYTRGTSTYPATSDPYANGGDPATHTTGTALTYDGYGLKGWLGVQKMKEIKQLVVDGTPSTLPTVTASASPTSITSGSASTLTWSSTNATTVSINQGIGTVTASGTRSVSPTVTTTYTVTATNAAGSVNRSVTVTVGAAPTLPTVTLSASPASITSGGASTLTWSSTNATSVSINQGIGTVTASGTRSVSPTATTTYTVTAANAAGSRTATAMVTVTAGSALPAAWTSADIGSPAIRGSATYSNGTFTVKGAGADVWGAADQFQFVYQPMTGDGQVIARVATLTNTNAWAKAGVMIRSQLTTGSAHAFALVSGASGTAFQRRVTAGGTSRNTAGPASVAPAWVRLVRLGNKFSAYTSSNGTTWTLVGSQSITMGATVYVGMAVTSHNTAALATSTLTNMQVQVFPTR